MSPRTQIVQIGLAGHAILVDGFPVARIEPANVPGRPIVPLEDYHAAVETLLAGLTALRDLAQSGPDDHGEWPELDRALEVGLGARGAP